MKWGTAIELGDKARASIKDQSLDYYLKELNLVRENTLNHLKSKTDSWLYEENQWENGILYNNYYLWFHVMEDENYEAFKGITEMTLSRCLMVYRSLEFSNVENDDDVIIFTFFLLDHNKVLYDDSHYTSSSEPYNRLIQKVRNLINEVDEQDKLDEFEAYLYSDENSSNQTITIEMIDTMNGYEFESFIAELFTRMGYKVQITQSAGDYGIDVIARKKEVSIGIQAKCYSNKVPNKAIQEAIAGISFYNLNKGLVVTNNYFTKQAQNQAIRSNIMLWDRNILNEKLIEFYSNGTNT